MPSNNLPIIQVVTDTFFSALPAIIVAIILVGGAFAAVIFGRKIVRKLQFGEQSRGQVRQAWQEVEEHVRAGDDTHLRMAVIKADAVLDMALKLRSFPGKTMNDRLRFATYKYHNLRRVRWAHGLRNALAHEPLRHLERREAQGAVAAFRNALREMGAL